MSRFAYKGVDLSPFLNVLKIERSIGNERNVTTEDTSKLGVNVQTVTFGAKVIKVKVSLSSREMPAQEFVDTTAYPIIDNTTLNNLRRKVAGLLYAETAYRLELPDEPDCYYMAIPKGDIELSGISDWYDETTIEFLIPDGVAHSNSYQRLTSDSATTTTGKIVFNVTNNGNVDAYPIITVEHRAPNDFLGIVNDSGGFEVGGETRIVKSSIETQNTTTKPAQSFETLDLSNARNALNSARKNIRLNNINLNLQDQLTIANDNIMVKKIGWSSGNTVTATNASWLLPTVAQSVDVFKEIISFKARFSRSIGSPYESMSILVTDTSGNATYGVRFSGGSNLQISIQLLVAVNNNLSVIKNITVSRYDDAFEIVRDASKVTFNFKGGSHSFQVNDLATSRSDAVMLLYETTSNSLSSTVSGVVTNLIVKKYREQATQSSATQAQTQQAANKSFSAGDDIVIDAESDIVTVNGIAHNDRIVDGSDWVSLPAGKSELTILYSPGATRAPNVTIEYEERWL